MRSSGPRGAVTLTPSGRVPRSTALALHPRHDLDARWSVEDERQTVDRLLVARHQADELVGVDAGRQPRVERVGPADDVVVLGDASIVDPAQRPRQVGGEDEPDRDRLAVRDPVIGGGLQGVGQRVAVVEQGPTTALALVGRHHLRLDLDTPGDALLVVQGEQVVTRQEVVLRHLAVAAAHLTRREGAQRIQVADDGTRLPERSDEVLALGKVDARLASDGGIDHRQQRCRDVDDRHAAVPRRGREPRHVGHHPPADADHAVVAGEPEPGETRDTATRSSPRT